jgi:hypothetical protein
MYIVYHLCTRGYKSVINKSMTFNDIHTQLLNENRMVTFASLTSDKTHTMLCTIPKNFQSNSDKVVVWDINNKAWADIEVSSIMSIA